MVSMPPFSPSLPPVVLASTSTWRLQLLASAGIEVRGEAHDVDEASIAAGDPRALALARARAKAHDVRRRLSREGGLGDAVVIGADQVAWIDDEVFGKPEDDADWRARLRMLRGRTHTLSTGVVLVGGAGGEVSFCEDSHVRFRGDLEDAELDAYVALGEARGCAGGYMAEGRGAWLIEGIEGDWNNVIGLPVFRLITELRRRGARLGGGP